MTNMEKKEYKDNWIDRLFIALFSRKMAKALGTKVRLEGYDGFVDLSKQIMRGRNPQQQQELVERVLKSLIPSPVVFLIRTFFPPPNGYVSLMPSLPLFCLNGWWENRK